MKWVWTVREQANSWTLNYSFIAIWSFSNFFPVLCPSWTLAKKILIGCVFMKALDCSFVQITLSFVIIIRRRRRWIRRRYFFFASHFLFVLRCSFSFSRLVIKSLILYGELDGMKAHENFWQQQHPAHTDKSLCTF